MRDGWKIALLGEFVKQSKKKVKVIKGKEYPAIGVMMEGRGFVTRPPFIGGVTTYKQLTPIEPNQLVLRSITAWEAPIQVTTQEHIGLHVSGVFPVFDIDATNLNPRFLALLCQFHPFWESMRERTVGSVLRRKTLSATALMEIPILLPKIPEQKRIVDLISSVDAYVEALQQQLESAKKSRNAVLHELLTAGGDDWLRAGLSEICTMIKRGQAPSYTEQKSVTVLNQKCVRNGRIQFEFARQTNSNIKPINEWAYLRAEDTLVNSTGVGTLGRVAFVGMQDEPLTVDSHLTIVRPDKNKIQPSFLGLSLHFREADIEGLAAGSSGQTELSREALGNLIITIPPLQEQKRIVEIISAMDTVANQTQLAITEAQNLRSGLLSDLLSGTHEIPLSYDKVIGAA